MKTHQRRDAFVRSVVQRFDRPLRRALRRQASDVSIVQDVVQELYLLLWTQTDEAQANIRSIGAYLFRVGQQRLRRWESKRRAFVQHESPLAAPEFLSDPLLERRLDAVLDALTPRQRAVLLLNRCDGYSLAEIGATLQISKSMVKQHLALALKVCRTRLKDLERRER